MYNISKINEIMCKVRKDSFDNIFSLIQRNKQLEEKWLYKLFNNNFILNNSYSNYIEFLNYYFSKKWNQ